MRHPAEPQIQHSKFKIQKYEIGLQPAEVAHDCKELRAAVLDWTQIQNSILKIMESGRSLRSARKFGNELRASAAPRLRPATPMRARFVKIAATG